jgi:hypothetical protein
VRETYQKNYAPLLLLWKGIGRWISLHPRYKIIFGAVSISNDYSFYSRQLMAAFLKNNRFVTDLSRWVRPRNPYRQLRIPELARKKVTHWPGDIEELSCWVSGIEADGKGIPILLKHYLKLGGVLLGFNVDQNFSNVLDGLMMVDLTSTDPRLLKRYMGAEGCAAFQMYHDNMRQQNSIRYQIPQDVYV